MVSHLIALAAAAIVVGGPFPACLALVNRAARESGGSSLPQRLVLASAGWCVLQMTVALALGIAGVLQLMPLLVAETVLLAGGAALIARHGWERTRREWRAAAPRLCPAETGIAIAVSTVGLMLLWQSVAQPVMDWDTWSFHLPAIARFVQSGSFARMDQYAERFRNSYPYGWEAMCTLLVLPFGEDFLVTLPNLLAWSLLGGSTYVLARSFDAARVHAMGAAALLLATPVLIVHVNTMHVDLPFGAFVVFALAAARLYALRSSPTWFAAALAASGAALAMRPTAVLYYPLVMAAAWMGRRRDRRALHSVTPVAGALLLGAVLAGYWYGRNFIASGNPFGGRAPGGGLPEITPIARFLRIVGTSLLATVDVTHLSSWRDLFLRTRGELSAPFVLAAILSGAAVVALALPRLRLRVRPLGPLALSAATAVLFWCTPTSAVSGAQVRLGMPFLGCLAATAAVGATAVRLRGMAMASLTLLIAAVACATSKALYIAIALITAAGAYRAPRARAVRATALLGIALLAIGGTVAARRWRAHLRPVFYGSFYTYLDNEVPADEPVAYLISDRSYFFYGTSLQRPVHFTPFHAGDDPQKWFADLDKRGIEFVAVGPQPGASASIEENFARLVEPNGRLIPVYGRKRLGEVTIYRVAPRQPPQPAD